MDIQREVVEKQVAANCSHEAEQKQEEFGDDVRIHCHDSNDHVDHVCSFHLGGHQAEI